MSIARSKWKLFIVVCKYIYTPLALSCIIYFTLKHRDLLSDIFSKANPTFLIFSLLLWTCLHLLAPMSPMIILGCLGYSLSYKKLLRIYVTRLPARYLPGGVWHTVSRLADYRSYGIAKKDLSMLAFFETVFPIPVTFFMGGSLLWLCSPGSLPNSLEIISTITGFIFLFVPIIILKHYPFRNTAPAKNILFYLVLLFLSIIFWFLAAGSFLFYYNSVSFELISIKTFFSVAGAYIFSWGAGYISIFAPQGFGVFEVVVEKIINMPMGFGSSVAFLAGFRLISLLADILIYVSYLVMKIICTEK